MSLLIFNVMCFSDNQIAVHGQTDKRNSYDDCDPLAWLAPGVEMVMTSNTVGVSIKINDISAHFRLYAQFQTVPERRPEKLEIRYVTRPLGMALLCVIKFVVITNFIIIILISLIGKMNNFMSMVTIDIIIVIVVFLVIVIRLRSYSHDDNDDH